MKSTKFLAIVTASATVFSMISPAAASASAADHYLTAGTQLSAAEFCRFDMNPASASSVNEAIAGVREQMRLRVFQFSVNVSLRCNSAAEANMLGIDILAKAMGETDKGNEGDYLRFSLRSYKLDYVTDMHGTTFYYDLDYFSSGEDESVVEKALAAAESQLGYEGKSDYEKICIAYDFVTSNAVYADEYDDDRIFTAYGALIDKTCVCQGYALLLYRLMKDMGLNCRIISGKSGDERHAWNMVLLGDRYFLLDPTWDSELGGSDGEFFLRGSNDFNDFDPENAHVPVFEYKEIFPDYESEEFKAAYPQSENKFILGDVNDDGIVDGNDASYVLTSYAKMSVNSEYSLQPVNFAAADITGNGIVDANDASGLLSYYAAASSGKVYSVKDYLKKKSK